MEDGENGAGVDGAVETVLRRLDMAELLGVEDDTVLRRLEIGSPDGFGIVVELNAAEAGDGSFAEIGKLFYFIKDDGTAAALA